MSLLKEAVKNKDNVLKYPITITLTKKDQERYFAFRKKLKKQDLYLSELSRKAIVKILNMLEKEL